MKIVAPEQSEQSERYTIRRLFLPSVLPSVNSYGGRGGVVVYLLDYDDRENSSDVREIYAYDVWEISSDVREIYAYDVWEISSDVREIYAYDVWEISSDVRKWFIPSLVFENSSSRAKRAKRAL